MARKRDESALAQSLNAELQAGAATTTAIPHVADRTPRDELGDLVVRLNAEKGRNWGINWKDRAAAVNPTQAYNKGATTAYPVSPTMAMPGISGAGRTTIASEKASERQAQQPQAISPVRIKGGRSPSGKDRPSVIHSTIKTLELMGEHAGHNKEIIENLVNR